MDCIFCKIINREISGNIIYEDDRVLAFSDILPKAPVHILVVPKEHVESAHHLSDDKMEIIAHIYKVIKKIAEEKGVAETGYRVITNIGTHGNQTVKHLHFHIIGGRQLS